MGRAGAVVTSTRHHRECDECGALLGDRAKHVAWHEAMTESFGAAAEYGERALKQQADAETRARQATAGL